MELGLHRTKTNLKKGEVMKKEKEFTAESLVTEAAELRERTASLSEQAEQLARKMRSVRGTRDMKKPVATAAAVVPSSHTSLARRAPARRADHPAPVGRGTESYVGDESSTAELMTTVQRLITERPSTFRELLDATGARDNRIKGVIMRLQRDGLDVVNLGNEARALWFIPNPELLKRLRAKRRP